MKKRDSRIERPSNLGNPNVTLKEDGTDPVGTPAPLLHKTLGTRQQLGTTRDTMNRTALISQKRSMLTHTEPRLEDNLGIGSPTLNQTVDIVRFTYVVLVFVQKIVVAGIFRENAVAHGFYSLIISH